LKDEDICGDGGLIKKKLVEGNGEHPPQGAIVRVDYVGTLLDGTEFDSSKKRGQKYTFTLGKGKVIKGWDLGVKAMSKGEKAILTCRYDYAYGEESPVDLIPKKSTLVFEVELYDWEDPEPETNEEKFKVYPKVKDRANDLFSKGEFKEAIQQYQKVLGYWGEKLWGVTEEEKKKKLLKLELSCIPTLRCAK